MKRSIFLVFLFPVVVVLWFVGWSLFWTGSNTQRKKQSQPTLEILVDTTALESQTIEATNNK
ncbi:MAG: hypothetical protein PVH12_07325 [Candidatus Bathyarchaeota archaeon]